MWITAQPPFVIDTITTDFDQYHGLLATMGLGRRILDHEQTHVAGRTADCPDPSRNGCIVSYSQQQHAKMMILTRNGLLLTSSLTLLACSYRNLSRASKLPLNYEQQCKHLKSIKSKLHRINHDYLGNMKQNIRYSCARFFSFFLN